MKRVLLIGFALVCFWTWNASGAGAAPPVNYTSIQSAIQVMEGSVSRIEGVLRHSETAFSKKDGLLKKFLNGVYLLKHKRPLDAAGLFLSIVQASPSTREGKEALFYLAEALYQSRNYLMATEYYTKAVLQGWSRRQRSIAVRRLIEISIKTHNYESIAKVLKLLDKVPELAKTEEVLYARGKWAYFLGEEEMRKPAARRNIAFAMQSFRDALGFFKKIDVRKEKGKNVYPVLYPQAVYYRAVCHIRLGEYEYAADEFTRIVLDKDLFKIYKDLEKLVKKRGLFLPRSDEEREVVILARLSLARLFVELGYVGEAVKWYRAIPQDSAHYEVALYELAWVFVQENQVELASQVLGLMAARNRNSVYLPKARLLLAHLNVRQKKWTKAAEHFSDTRRRYSAVYDSLRRVMGDGISYRILFRQLREKKAGAKGANRSVVGYDLPPEVYPLIARDRLLTTARAVVDDLDEVNKGLKEAEDSLRVVKVRLSTGSKVGIFPVLGDLRRKTYRMESALATHRNALLARFSSVFVSYLPPDAAKSFKALEKERARLEKALSQLPRSTDTAKSRQKKIKSTYKALQMQVDSLKSDVRLYRNFLTGLLDYLNNRMKPERRARMKPLVLPQLRALMEEIDTLSESLDELHGKLEDASIAVGGQDDSILTRELNLQEKYLDLLKKELEVIAQAKGRVSASQAVEFDRLYTTLSSIASLMTKFLAVDRRIYDIAVAKLQEIRSEIKVEEIKIRDYRAEYKKYFKKSDEIAQVVTDETFSNVSRQFHQVVVDADLGIVDIMWTRNSLVKGKLAGIEKRFSEKDEEVKTRAEYILEIDDALDTSVADPFVPKKSKAKSSDKKQGKQSGQPEKGSRNKKQSRKTHGKKRHGRRGR